MGAIVTVLVQVQSLPPHGQQAGCLVYNSGVRIFLLLPSDVNIALHESLVTIDNRQAYITGGLTMKADAATEVAVLATVNRFTEAYRTRDRDALLAVIAPDADAMLFGTGADERRIGPAEILAQAERDWSQSDAATFDFSWTSVSAAGTVAWVAAEGVVRATAGGQEVTLPIRMTMVFERRGEP